MLEKSRLDRINELAKLLANNKDSLENIATSSDGTFTCEDDGYYIIVETPVGSVDGSTTCHLLGTYDSAVGADINVKASKPSVVKKVKENIKTGDWSSDTYGTGFNDVADYSIGDNVPFKLIATLPSDIDIYDNLENSGAGLSVRADSLVVDGTMKNDAADGNLTLNLDSWTVAGGDEGTYSFVNNGNFDAVVSGKTYLAYGMNLSGMAVDNSFSLDTGELDFGPNASSDTWFSAFSNKLNYRYQIHQVIIA